MAKKKKLKKIKKTDKIAVIKKSLAIFQLNLPEDTKKKIYGIIMFLIAVIISLSFFSRAGIGGEFLISSLDFLIGRTIFVLPFLFVLAGLALLSIKTELKSKKEQRLIIAAILLAILGIAGILGLFGSEQGKIREYGGFLGYLISFPLIKILGTLGAGVVFAAIIIIGGIILYQIAPHLFVNINKKKINNSKMPVIKEKKSSFASRLFQKAAINSDFKVKEIDQGQILKNETKKSAEKLGGFFQKKKKLEIKQEPQLATASESAYQLPSLDLLEQDSGVPYSGDIRMNSSIIEKTLKDFDIPVEMSEVNIGPTVTQYTLKPAEGIKLSKITGLNNDLSLSLASHPIRIEAPIPGRSLVGIEIPNKKRIKIGLRSLLKDSRFQESQACLNLALGKDVAGNPVFADIAKMPHLLVAGSTGSGKTICLNGIILSLLYKNSPSSLRLILVDPKRVEFNVYNNLPHLLSPVIFTPQKTVDVLKWLIGEMERRFDVLSEAKTRDIISYNKTITKNLNSKNKLSEENLEIMPYIVLIIDELADIMAARGREVEAGIVRLAQMSRAVGIHLIVATQRPSVEVITGLIKANITSRITFQVASQVDSRTILDMAGAEKLLGAGDMLFTSSSVGKPKRIQGAFISEKEVNKVVDYIKSLSQENMEYEIEQEITETNRETNQNFEKTLEPSETENISKQEDAMYEEAKKIVIQAKKASASLLQRRLRLGYARAARLIDILEERKVIGPGDGAKPREVYIKDDEESKLDNDGFVKV